MSGGLRGSLLWWAGRISSFTFSDVAAKSWVASNNEQCSVLVPSMERIWSPTCKAPHLQEKHRNRGVTSVNDNSNSKSSKFPLMCSLTKFLWQCIKSGFCCIIPSNHTFSWVFLFWVLSWVWARFSCFTACCSFSSKVHWNYQKWCKYHHVLCDLSTLTPI